MTSINGPNAVTVNLQTISQRFRRRKGVSRDMARRFWQGYYHTAWRSWQGRLLGGGAINGSPDGGDEGDDESGGDDGGSGDDDGGSGDDGDDDGGSGGFFDGGNFFD